MHSSSNAQGLHNIMSQNLSFLKLLLCYQRLVVYSLHALLDYIKAY